MEKPLFADDVNISIATHNDEDHDNDNNYHDYNISNTSKVSEITFAMPPPTE